MLCGILQVPDAAAQVWQGGLLAAAATAHWPAMLQHEACFALLHAISQGGAAYIDQVRGMHAM